MNFLLDENFPRGAVEHLERLGHTCFEMRGSAIKGANDAEVASEAQRLGAVLLTTDRDFYHTIGHQFPDHLGIVVVALKQPNRDAIIERLTWLLTYVNPDQLRARAFQLQDNTWIARPPLDD